MTSYHHKEAKKRLRIDGYICQVCGKLLKNKIGAGAAHRIPKTKINLRKWKAEIINHNFNLVYTCSLECNSKVLIENKPHIKILLFGLIRHKDLEDLTTRQINDIIGVKKWN
jgi:hypothetical protein